jgi:hypothetical protein
MLLKVLDRRNEKMYVMQHNMYDLFVCRFRLPYVSAGMRHVERIIGGFVIRSVSGTSQTRYGYQVVMHKKLS